MWISFFMLSYLCRLLFVCLLCRHITIYYLRIEFETQISYQWKTVTLEHSFFWMKSLVCLLKIHVKTIERLSFRELRTNYSSVFFLEQNSITLIILLSNPGIEHTSLDSNPETSWMCSSAVYLLWICENTESTIAHSNISVFANRNTPILLLLTTHYYSALYFLRTLLMCMRFLSVYWDMTRCVYRINKNNSRLMRSWCPR